MGDHTVRVPDIGGEANFGGPAELIGHPARAAIMLALLDGRALPMSVLASEAGVAASTASAHLTRMASAGLLRVIPQGRHRYYSIASPAVAEALEALARLAPPAPVASLRADRRARELRLARTCYDHMAGKLGVAVMESLIYTGALTGGDGRHHPEAGGLDRLSAPGRDIEYRLTERGRELFDELAVVVRPGNRPFIRYCVDWTEQRHHLAGALGAALLARFESLGWVEHGHRNVRRALRVTDQGLRALDSHFGLDISPFSGSAAA
jgi:DNA-binding transcriptional ArsR family regulator